MKSQPQHFFGEGPNRSCNRGLPCAATGEKHQRWFVRERFRDLLSGRVVRFTRERYGKKTRMSLVVMSGMASEVENIEMAFRMRMHQVPEFIEISAFLNYQRQPKPAPCIP